MNSRRGLLVTVGVVAVAGCTTRGQTDTGQTEPAAGATTDDGENAGRQSRKAGEERSDWTAGQLHDQYIGDSYLDENELMQTYVQARQENGLIHGIGATLHEASEQLGGLQSDNYEQRHKWAVAAVNDVLGDQHQLYSLQSTGDSVSYSDGDFEFTKVWLEGHEDMDINAALTPDSEHAVHIEGTPAEGPHEEAIKSFRNAEKWGNRPSHDEEALDNAVEHYRENRGKEYSEEKLDEVEGTDLVEYDAHIWGDGIAVPVEEDRDDYHENLHTLLPELNVQYHTSEDVERGEMAVFTVEDGEVEIYQAPEGYDLATDGPITKEEIR